MPYFAGGTNGGLRADLGTQSLWPYHATPCTWRPAHPGAFNPIWSVHSDTKPTHVCLLDSAFFHLLPRVYVCMLQAQLMPSSHTATTPSTTLRSHPFYHTSKTKAWASSMHPRCPWGSYHPVDRCLGIQHPSLSRKHALRQQRMLPAKGQTWRIWR